MKNMLNEVGEILADTKLFDEKKEISRNDVSAAIARCIPDNASADLAIHLSMFGADIMFELF